MISSLFMESALRSVLLALAVWIGLRVFAVRNVLAQKVAWGLVLASALTMPVVLPMAEHWSVLPANVRVTIPADPANLLEELQARLQAGKSPAPKPSAVGAFWWGRIDIGGIIERRRSAPGSAKTEGPFADRCSPASKRCCCCAERHWRSISRAGAIAFRYR